jgi:hypothetical protein
MENLFLIIICASFAGIFIIVIIEILKAFGIDRLLFKWFLMCLLYMVEADIKHGDLNGELRSTKMTVRVLKIKIIKLQKNKK